MNENDKSTGPSASESSIQPPPNEAVILQKIIAELTPLSQEDRSRLVETIITFYGLDVSRQVPSAVSHPMTRIASPRGASFQFSEEDETPSPKDFMLRKSPRTDVERVACLAYYLSHYRDTPHFKTSDITKVNTESAHRRFSNTADAVDNATRAGYLVPSIKGCKQLSASGERFVEALPDREAAKEAMEPARPRHSSRPSKVKNPREV